MDSIRGGNPFTPMAGIDPKFFGGRKKELEYFKEKLNNVIINDFCEHFLILGDWGIGKSALLSEFKKICQNQGFIAPIVKLETFQQNDRLSDAANSIVSLVLRGLPFDIKQFQKVIDFFNSIGITILGSGFKIERRDNKHLMPEAFLHDFFINLYDDIKYKHKSKVLVILLDDLSNL